MKTANVLLLTLFFCLLICSCDRVDIPYIEDYYGECNFELPFEYKDGNYSGSVIYFSTEYSMEQMCELINSAGYSAELFEIDSLPTILITVEQDSSAYYFAVYDKEFNDSEKYEFTNCTLSLNIPNAGRYSILAPIHIIDKNFSRDDERISFKVYNSFEYIADFYRASGKKDFVIDESDKTITFECKGKTDLSYVESEVEIRYVETSDDCYLEITQIKK